jgi:hypothetical protein
MFSCGVRAEILDDLFRDVAPYPVVRAEFEQTRRMAVMKRPLVIRGRLTFSRGQGVLWRIEQPYRMSYVLGETRIVEIGEDGARRVREARDVPGLAQVSRFFRAMLGADPSVLREHFDVAARGDASRWTLELSPRQAQIGQFLEGLQLSGGRFIEEIRIDEAGGDSTRILFTDSQGADAPTEAEARLFDGEMPESVEP